jgi:hypothetical protein
MHVSVKGLLKLQCLLFKTRVHGAGLRNDPLSVCLFLRLNLCCLLRFFLLLHGVGLLDQVLPLFGYASRRNFVLCRSSAWSTLTHPINLTRGEVSVMLRHQDRTCRTSRIFVRSSMPKLRDANKSVMPKLCDANKRTTHSSDSFFDVETVNRRARRGLLLLCGLQRVLS